MVAGISDLATGPGPTGVREFGVVTDVSELDVVEGVRVRAPEVDDEVVTEAAGPLLVSC